MVAQTSTSRQLPYPLTNVKGYYFMTFYYSRGTTTATGIMQKKSLISEGLGLLEWVWF
jgi:hypothetical protein